MNDFLAFIGPIALILIFYLVLGGALWIIFQPAATRRALAVRLAHSADGARRLRTWLVILVAVAIVALLVQFRASLYLQLTLTQVAVGIALLFGVDQVIRYRLQRHDRLRMLVALRSPIASTAHHAIHEARLSGALQDGTLSGQDFSRAHWPAADLSAADLHAAILVGVDLSKANLTCANLTAADLTGANLAGADLRDADLSYAILNHVQAKSVNLRGARLTGASLVNAKLQRADLQRTDMRASDIRGANLRQADLTGATLISLRRDERTRLPKHIVAQLSAQAAVTQFTDEELPEQSLGTLR